MVFNKQATGTDLSLAFGVAAIVLLLSFLQFYESIELKLLDLRFNLRGPIETRSDIATVDIDVNALQKEGRWQDWSRDKHARLIQFAQTEMVGMLAFDIYFSEPSTPYLPLDFLNELDNKMDKNSLSALIKDNDEYMRQKLLSAGNVILSQSFKPLSKGEKLKIKNRSPGQERALELLSPFYQNWESNNDQLFSFYDIEPPIEGFITSAKAIGFAQAQADRDGTMRRYPLIGSYDGRLFPSIVMLMVCDYLGTSFKMVNVVLGEFVEIPRIDDLPLRIPISEAGFMNVNWAGDWVDDFIHYPYNLALDFARDNLDNSVLHAVKQILFKNPNLYRSPPEFLRAAEGIEHLAMVKKSFSKLMQSNSVEQALINNPDWTAVTFFTAQGLPENRISPAMENFFKEIKTNLIMEDYLLQENPAFESQVFDSVAAELDLEILPFTRWNYNIIRNFIKSDPENESIHPLFFFPYKSKIIFQGKQLAPFEFRNKMLFYGLTATGTHDLNPMPFNARYPMVGLHANALNTILSQNFIIRASKPIEALIIFLIALVIGLFISRLHPLAGGGTTIFLWAATALVNVYLFSNKGLWIDFLGPSLVFLISYLSLTLYNFISEEKNKKFLHNTFKAYLSPELIDQMYKEKQMPELGGKEGNRTAYFTDIQSFSTMAEKLGNPTDLVNLLNEYLTAMTDILLEHQGTLDKYEGDAIIAIFGAPVHLDDHAERACNAALAMQKKLGELQEKWQSEGDKWPEIVKNMKMRIGINSGAMVTGNMGSSTRMNYT
ncbi:MAG: adenylate/guanylate cyclase domain-containing protein, partial [Candidatus Neomarinimicrobiota bacterium]